MAIFNSFLYVHQRVSQELLPNEFQQVVVYILYSLRLAGSHPSRKNDWNPAVNPHFPAANQGNNDTQLGAKIFFFTACPSYSMLFPSNDHSYFIALWLFNIAMENGPIMPHAVRWRAFTEKFSTCWNFRCWLREHDQFCFIYPAYSTEYPSMCQYVPWFSMIFSLKPEVVRVLYIHSWSQYVIHNISSYTMWKYHKYSLNIPFTCHWLSMKSPWKSSINLPLICPLICHWSIDIPLMSH